MMVCPMVFELRQVLVLSLLKELHLLKALHLLKEQRHLLVRYLKEVHWYLACLPHLYPYSALRHRWD